MLGCDPITAIAEEILGTCGICGVVHGPSGQTDPTDVMKGQVGTKSGLRLPLKCVV
jgi:hypothetical protein